MITVMEEHNSNIEDPTLSSETDVPDLPSLLKLKSQESFAFPNSEQIGKEVDDINDTSFDNTNSPVCTEEFSNCPAMTESKIAHCDQMPLTFPLNEIKPDILYDKAKNVCNNQNMSIALRNKLEIATSWNFNKSPGIILDAALLELLFSSPSIPGNKLSLIYDSIGIPHDQPPLLSTQENKPISNPTSSISQLQSTGSNNFSSAKDVRPSTGDQILHTTAIQYSTPKLSSSFPQLQQLVQSILPTVLKSEDMTTANDKSNGDEKIAKYLASEPSDRGSSIFDHSLDNSEYADSLLEETATLESLDLRELENEVSLRRNSAGIYKADINMETQHDSSTEFKDSNYGNLLCKFPKRTASLDKASFHKETVLTSDLSMPNEENTFPNVKATDILKRLPEIYFGQNPWIASPFSYAPHQFGDFIPGKPAFDMNSFSDESETDKTISDRASPIIDDTKDFEVISNASSFVGISKKKIDESTIGSEIFDNERSTDKKGFEYPPSIMDLTTDSEDISNTSIMRKINQAISKSIKAIEVIDNKLIQFSPEEKKPREPEVKKLNEPEVKKLTEPEIKRRSGGDAEKPCPPENKKLSKPEEKMPGKPEEKKSNVPEEKEGSVENHELNHKSKVNPKKKHIFKFFERFRFWKKKSK